MNCCDDYGQCTQGAGCPARCTPLITKQGLRQVPPEVDCGCNDLPAPTRLTERQDEPMGVWEGITVYGGILAGVVVLALATAAASSLIFEAIRTRLS